jgi:hypothetical protein
MLQLYACSVRIVSFLIDDNIEYLTGIQLLGFWIILTSVGVCNTVQKNLAYFLFVMYLLL